jgi:hypothetical protein
MREALDDVAWPAAELAAEAGAGSDTTRLVELAARGLERMFDPGSGLFCFKRERNPQGVVVPRGESVRYSLISLLGLHRFEQAGCASPIGVRETLLRFLEEPARISKLGDLGLLLWAFAQTMPEEVARVWAAFDPAGALERLPDGRQRKTMELSWFLTGLSYCRELAPRRAGLEALGRRACELLLANYVPATGLFYHQGKGGLVGGLRGRFSNFADQSYPIYALTACWRASRDSEALRAALSCAEALCALQGPLGQWWWHYDAERGRVLSKYPVYSVHQDGMGPMALLAVGEATGVDFSGPLHRGLAWVWGRNELGRNLVEGSEDLIWRSLRRPGRHRRSLETALSFFAGRRWGEEGLLVCHECRPYHLGWLLYALARRT